ncbi:hypothetical protein PFISCL1PPCAC_7752 [Pristionchus fissidentatus]|uniref:gamma-glutamylcyclotransferase n=1 Tax=Pristionchus fissidentatus TaxID=1538716 RepID=A0AAV5VEW3_9BILA|nr:hypothetical protein PFISCL1PPCAC_7752 [Pristionchus fissidentatus]
MTELNGDHFNYFAYGSNLLKERIHVQIAGAEFISAGRLPHYELIFAGFGERWQGAAASVREKKGDEVWGCVWRVPNSFAAELDLQEGWYDRRTVSVETAAGPVACRTYVMREADGNENKPSPHYKLVIVNGAIEHALPPAYVDRLKKVEDNGYRGAVQVPISFLKSLL